MKSNQEVCEECEGCCHVAGKIAKAMEMLANGQVCREEGYICRRYILMRGEILIVHGEAKQPGNPPE